MGERVQFDVFSIWPWGKTNFVEEIIRRGKLRIKTFASYLNAHTYNLACRDKHYRTILSQTDILYPDGISIVWGVRLLGARRIERMTGVDFFERFIQRAQESGVRVYFLGGEPGVVEQMNETFKKKYPNLQVMGMHNGFFKQDEIYAEKIISDINSSNPDVLLVGLGSPIQEKFVQKYRDRLTVPVIWTVGALFDYWGGREQAAPRWLANLGFEWFWRLCRDPKNKWRRYLIGNAIFVVRLTQLILRKKFSGA